MADEKEDAVGGGREDASPTISQLIIPKRIASIARIIISKLPPPPPPPQLLPVSVTNSSDADAHYIITENLQKLELGKLAFTLATTATLGLLFSHNFPAAETDYLVVVGFMAACAVVWNGILFGKNSLQLLGISLILLCLFALVASFLPLRFSWACWLFAAFSLIPFISLLIKLPHP